MKRINLTFGILFMLFIGACSNVSEQSTLTDSDIMAILHCSDMRMAGCEKYDGIELTKEQINRGCQMMPMMSACEDNSVIDINQVKTSSNVNKQFTSKITNLKLAKPSEVYELNNGDKIDMSIDIIKKEIAGQEVRMFGYNGMIPGPMLSVKQNSSIFVNVTNNLDIETTVHWHGLRLENKFDGVPELTMKTQKPGESFEYKLDFVDEGIYWYHPHVREDYTQELGLYGNMLVDSKYEDYYNYVNEEVPIILDDILIENGKIAPFFDGEITHSLMGRFGNIMLTNGDDDLNLEYNKGDVVRFYITNVANTRTFNFSIPGVQIKLIGSDIGSYEKEEFVDSVIIAPAERYTIEAYFEKEGEYKFKNINPSNEYDLAKIKINNKDIDNDYSADFISLRENKYVKEDIDSYREYFNKEVDVNIDLSVEMSGMGMRSMMMDNDEEESEEYKAMREHCQMMPNMAGCESYLEESGENHNSNMENMMMVEDHDLKIEWEDEMQMMNLRSNNKTVDWILKDKDSGKENMEIDLDFKVGDKVKIRIFNDPKSVHPMQHPIHFHGQRFLVLEKDGNVNDNLVWKDTVLIPVGSSVDILLDVTNPGEWMAHCHIAEHLQSGMMLTFKVSN